MFDAEHVGEALSELKRLNDNLEILHRDAEDLKPLKSDIRSIVAQMRELKTGAHGVLSAARELRLLNQILLQIKKVSGWSGVVRHLLDGLLKTVKGPL